MPQKIREKRRKSGRQKNIIQTPAGLMLKDDHRAVCEEKGGEGREVWS